MEQRLAAIQQDNEKKLEQIRATVDEKLHATLEQRLGESFKQVADRLEQVHRGLGEMQRLASDVGSLNRVLNNVKTRGVLRRGAARRPARAGVHARAVRDQRRDRAGQRRAGRVRDQAAGPARRRRAAVAADRLQVPARGLRAPARRAGARRPGRRRGRRRRRSRTRLRAEARTIREKYVAPPHTTDFGILFVPTEGLYAEALRRPGLVEALQREHKVMLAGPTTLLATLTSLQMGFRTLALEKRIVRGLGGAGRGQDRVRQVRRRAGQDARRSCEEASNTIDDAEVRTRAMARSLRQVEALPDARAQAHAAGPARRRRRAPMPEAADRAADAAPRRCRRACGCRRCSR